MYSVQEICEEQERQYNQLMEEDGQYCHPESFKWGFEHGFEYALRKFGWHPASDLPPIDKKTGLSDEVIAIQDMFCEGEHVIYSRIVGSGWKHDNIKWWIEQPQKRNEIWEDARNTK